jgi:hypothetical protein
MVKLTISLQQTCLSRHKSVIAAAHRLKMI